MTSRPFISNSSLRVLRTSIGAVVDYGVFPNLRVARTGSTGLPAVHAAERDGQATFFEAWPITLRVQLNSKRHAWLGLDAGPDEPGSSEALVAGNPPGPRLGPCGSLEFSDGWKLPESETDVRPAIIHLWSRAPTAIMSVCRLGTYGALVVSHQDNSTWAFYGEYDGGTFVTFDKHVCDALRAESDETTEVS
ncbi:MAG: hypothetical protein AB8H86_15375 [Polyangiales bacterium]